MELDKKTSLSCVVIDPDVYSIRNLIKIIRNSSRLELVHSSKSGRSALNYLRNNKADVVFLNPALSDVNGFDLIASLPNRPLTIVISDRDEYAYFAFQIGAMDYLLKPVTAPKIEKCVDRVLEKVNADHELHFLREKFARLQSGEEG